MAPLLVRLLSRIAQCVFVVFLAATIAFALLHAAPGDPFSDVQDASLVTPELREQWRSQRGFDQPVFAQYVRRLRELAQGDLGYSVSKDRPVVELLRSHIPNTLWLMSGALLGSVLLGSALGAWQGARVGSRSDRVASFVSMLTYSLPEFWLASVLSVVFVAQLHWLPSAGMIDVALHDSMSPLMQLRDRARHYVLPWMSLTLIGAAIFARYQRAAMVEALREPFIQTALAKGLSHTTTRRQAWRLASLPVVTLTGLFFPSLLTGAVFVEQIYGWPGVGSLLIEGVSGRDYDLVSACVIIGSAMTAIGSLVADVLRVVIDPRLRAA